MKLEQIDVFAKRVIFMGLRQLDEKQLLRIRRHLYAKKPVLLNGHVFENGVG